VIKPSRARGVEINDDDFIIDPNLMIPAPEIYGKVTDVHIESDQVIQVYGGDRKASGSRPLVPSDRNASNYMYFQGGPIRFGKLTMSNADMQIVDAHPKDPFDFFLSCRATGSRRVRPRYSRCLDPRQTTTRIGIVTYRKLRRRFGGGEAPARYRHCDHTGRWHRIDAREV
jgi:hypothetical protein